jgi:hypothetical protein
VRSPERNAHPVCRQVGTTFPRPSKWKMPASARIGSSHAKARSSSSRRPNPCPSNCSPSPSVSQSRSSSQRVSGATGSRAGEREPNKSLNPTATTVLLGLVGVQPERISFQARALHPVGVQTMRAGGSSPCLTAASTGLRPCVRSACRVASATSPRSSRFMASRETSTRVHTSRPSDAVDLTDHEAQTSFFSGVTLFDSLTLHFSVTRGARSEFSVQACGRTKNAIAASWQPAAATVSRWKSS